MRLLSERPNFLDYAKVIAMFMTIFCHVHDFGGVETEDKIMYFFRCGFSSCNLAIFFIVSGALSKVDAWDVMFRKIKEQLITPYILIGLICLAVGVSLKLIVNGFTDMPRFICGNLLGLLNVDDFQGYRMAYSLPLWFLIVIAEMKLLLAVAERTKWGGDYLYKLNCHYASF